MPNRIVDGLAVSVPSRRNFFGGGLDNPEGEETAAAPTNTAKRRANRGKSPFPVQRPEVVPPGPPTLGLSAAMNGMGISAPVSARTRMRMRKGFPLPAPPPEPEAAGGSSHRGPVHGLGVTVPSSRAFFGGGLDNPDDDDVDDDASARKRLKKKGRSEFGVPPEGGDVCEEDPEAWSAAAGSAVRQPPQQQGRRRSNSFARNRPRRGAQ